GDDAVVAADDALGQHDHRAPGRRGRLPRAAREPRPHLGDARRAHDRPPAGPRAPGPAVARARPRLHRHRADLLRPRLPRARHDDARPLRHARGAERRPGAGGAGVGLDERRRGAPRLARDHDGVELTRRVPVALNEATARPPTARPSLSTDACVTSAITGPTCTRTRCATCTSERTSASITFSAESAWRSSPTEISHG